MTAKIEVGSIVVHSNPFASGNHIGLVLEISLPPAGHDSADDIISVRWFSNGVIMRYYPPGLRKIL